MRDLVFYNFDFNHLWDSRKYISVNWTINFSTYGTFEAHFPKNHVGLIEILDKNDYILCVQGDRQAVITAWQIDEDIAVFGKTPEWLMTKRKITDFTLENALTSAIASHCVSSTMSDFVTVTPSFFGVETTYSPDDSKTVYDTVCEVVKNADLGFKLRADISAKTFNFTVYQGKELDTLLSQSNKSSHSMTYTKDRLSSASGSGWYKRKIIDKGNWNAYTNSPTLQNNSPDNAFTYYKITSQATRFGFNCPVGYYLYSATNTGTWAISETVPEPVWIYVDNYSATGAKKWDYIVRDTVADTESANKALEEIRSKTVIETIEAEVRRLEYDTDYSLGDSIRFQFETGDFKKTLTKKVKGVQIYYDTDKCGVRPILED